RAGERVGELVDRLLDAHGIHQRLLDAGIEIERADEAAPQLVDVRRRAILRQLRDDVRGFDERVVRAIRPRAVAPRAHPAQAPPRDAFFTDVDGDVRRAAVRADGAAV